ncbi:MAG: DUF350 domain-containing protein [Elusimicrobia bacterium]|nr:DUF350 domain-containing protein [Elusimicrobiota bacterium]
MFFTRLILALAEFGLSAILAALVILLTYRGFLWMMPHMNGQEEIRKGNAAVAIQLGALMIGAALIIQKAIYPVVGILMVGLTGEAAGAKDMLLLGAYAAGHILFGFLLSVCCVWLSLKFFEKLTGDMDEDGEIRKGNVPVAVVLAAVILVLSMYMKEGVSAMTKSLIPQPKLGTLEMTR